MRVIHLITLSCMLAFLTACQTKLEPAPLQDGIVMVPPERGVAEIYAAFYGKWEGTWGQELNSKLVVFEVTPPTAKAVYAWGTSKEVRNSGNQILTGGFNGEELIFTTENGAVITFKMNSNGSLSGKYVRRDINASGTFIKIE